MLTNVPIKNVIQVTKNAFVKGLPCGADVSRLKPQPSLQSHTGGLCFQALTPAAPSH